MLMPNTVKTLIIPAAGAGTRLLPLTLAMPKEMLRLVDNPIFSYLFSEAYVAGIRRVIFVIHSENRTTKKFLLSPAGRAFLLPFPGLKISFVVTQSRRGDGHAILAAQKHLKKNEMFAVTMGDLVVMPGQSILKELAQVYAIGGNSVISVEEVPLANVKNYGVIDPGEAVSRDVYRVRGIVEKPSARRAPSNLAMTGKYILSTDIFPYLTALLREKSRAGNECKLSEALNKYAQAHILCALRAKTPHFDTGTKTALFKTELIFSLAHPILGKKMRTILHDVSTAIFSKKRKHR